MKSRQVTLHLEANTPGELSLLTIKAQDRWGMTLEFFDFMQNKAGKYICWYQVPHQRWAEAVSNVGS